MVTTINQILNVFRTYNSKILPGKNVKNLPDKNFSDMVSNQTEPVDSGSTKAEINDTIRKNKLQYSLNDEKETVVQVIRDKTGKIVRTIPLKEQHILDIFE